VDTLRFFPTPDGFGEGTSCHGVGVGVRADVAVQPETQEVLATTARRVAIAAEESDHPRMVRIGVNWPALSWTN